MGCHQPPHLPTLKAYPTPGVDGKFGIFSLKWRERMNLKVPGAILPLGCAILSTRAKTVRGLLQPPLGELGLKLKMHVNSCNLKLEFSITEKHVYLYTLQMSDHPHFHIISNFSCFYHFQQCHKNWTILTNPTFETEKTYFVQIFILTSEQELLL